jgi:hypothetical protein
MKTLSIDEIRRLRLKVFAKIGYDDAEEDEEKENTNESSWIEDFEVKDIFNAEEEIKQIVDNFNSSLRPVEKPRVFIQLVTKK